MNTTIETITNHRSIRQFTADPIRPEILESILQCAQSSSSSSFLQCVSIIRVQNKETRSQLVDCAGGQPYVAESAEFLVFCMDFHRHQEIYPEAQLGFAEQTLIGAVDAGIMGQNALIAAESLGLGGVFIGGIRNQLNVVSELLGLPKYVVPLFGLCLGYPDQTPECKPRLPLSLLVYEDRYECAVNSQTLAHYDEKMASYYQSRSGKTKETTWSAQLETILKKEARPYMAEFLKSKGFNLK